MPNNTDGLWEDLKNWPLIGLHAIVTQSGKVLTFGTDSRGMQGAQFIYDVYDPVTDTHETLTNTTPTDIFCSAAIILPGTDKILIGGGDRRPLGAPNKGVNDVNEFTDGDNSLEASQLGDMNFARWYPTMVSLPTGQVVILGGTDQNGRGVAIPEIFTPGEGWRKLDGASDPDLAAGSLYPRAFVNKDGMVVYVQTGRGNDLKHEVMVLDPSGDGSLTEIGHLPFGFAWDSPAIMYETGKVMFLASNNDVWVMDINGPTPVFTKSTSLSQERNWADLTVLADGTVLINGGTSIGNKEAGADKTAAIWDPDTNTITYGADEDQPRLYHSASVLLADGSVLSLGGGSAGSAENNYLDSQIYKPPYLFNADGSEATRPTISGVPQSVKPGETFTITAGNAADIAKLTFVKSGAATHSFNMEARMTELDFTVGADNQIVVTMPGNANEVTAGSWMLFAWDKAGVPSLAPMVSVEPSLPLFDGIGDLHTEFITIKADVTSLDQIDFETSRAVHVQRDDELSWNSDNSGFYTGGQASDFAIRSFGEFDVSRSGDYVFYLNSDDGARLYINGKLVIENDGMHGPVTKSATVNLAYGTHDIEVRYFEGGGPGTLDLEWSGPGFARKQMTFDGAEDNLLVNGSVEMAEIKAAKVVDSLSGWQADNNFELFSQANGSMKATSGDVFMEVSHARGTISQAVTTQARHHYSLSLDVAGRAGQLASSKMEVLWNGTVIATITPTKTQFERFEFDVVGTGGKDVLAFRAVSGDLDDYGAFVDAIVLKPTGEIDPPAEVLYYDNAGANEALDGPNKTDIFVIDGLSKDYNWAPTDDGKGILVWNASNYDILENFEAIRFTDKEIDLTADNVGQIFAVNDPEQSEYINGTAGQDKFIINGASAGYSWVKVEGGAAVMVWNETGFDMLYDIESLEFTDRVIDLTAAQVGELNIKDDPNAEQYLSGTQGNDSFIIDGPSSDYQWAPSNDGNGVLVWNESGFDILYDFEALKFTDRTVKLTGEGSEAMKVINVAGETEYISGTDGKDVYVIEASSKDYNWARSDDGAGVLIWLDEYFDIIYDFEILRFSDKEVDLTADKLGQLIVADDSSQVEYISGTEGTDVFVIDGVAEDFGFAHTDDGNGVVVYNDATGRHDFLYGFEEVAFNNGTVTIQDELA
ncbi:MAG: DUF1929 domain-containing protein [Cohaesibacter sp.]|jgi:hypothetical protein|nr:DUF1929 domain-containing protein [Cohaesibacter sp.]